MKNNISIFIVIIFLLDLEGVNKAQTSSVDPKSFHCHYISNGSCVTEITIHFQKDIQDTFNIAIDYNSTSNSTRAVDCDWAKGNFTCLNDNRYTYKTPVNGILKVYVNQSDCVTAATLTFIVNQNLKISCELQQDFNYTSGNGSCTEVTTPSNGTFASAVPTVITTPDVKDDSTQEPKVTATGIAVGVSFAVLAVLAVGGAAVFHNRENLKNYFSRHNTETRIEERVENEATSQLNETSQPFLEIPEDQQPRE